MSDALDVLREIGAQKIYEDTHISLKHVKSVINESFEGLTKVQFLGFISIIEREYNQDLSALKAKGLSYIESESVANPSQKSVFIERKRTKSPTPIYIFIALLVFILVAYFTIGTKSSAPEKVQIDNSTIVTAQKNINPAYEAKYIDTNISDANSTIGDKNKTISLVVVEELEEEEVKVEPSFKVMVKTRLWIGYINKTDNIKKQTIIKESLDLDPSKEWLLSLGHGHVNIAINGELQEFKEPSNIRFLYKDGKLRKLNFRDFKNLNEGRAW